MRRVALAVPDWPGHVPGQHVDVRLTAEDGYSAQRSYSIASAPEADTVDLVVQRVGDGEVSPYLTEVLGVGDRVELRGPIGGHFVWPEGEGPVQLVAAGSGVAPFLAMLDHHAAFGSTRPLRLLYSARTIDDVIGRDRLADADARGVGVTVALTRAQPPGWDGVAGRVDREVLAASAFPPSDRPAVLVCGPTTFVEAVADALVDLGHAPERVKTERFGGLGAGRTR